MKPYALLGKDHEEKHSGHKYRYHASAHNDQFEKLIKN
jgi:hypothetical protein